MLKENSIIFHVSTGLEFSEIARNFYNEELEDILSFKTPMLVVALLFILFNLLFKLTAAPFHF